MEQKIICLGNDFVVKDENGNSMYYIDGKAFSFGQKLSFQDMNKNELCFIAQKHLKMKPTYSVTKDGQELAKITKSIMSFRDNFTIDVPGPDDISVSGSWIEHEYSFKRNHNVIANVSKKWFRMSDTYGIEIFNSNDTLLVLSCAVVIDLMCHNDKKKK